MTKAGITRVQITDTIQGQGAWRFRDAARLHIHANALYQQVFQDIGAPLLPGTEQLHCTKDEFKAGYDYLLGIDVLLRFQTGQVATLQEKFLFTKFETVTVEYYQNPGQEIEGDWFNLKCQFYFVGYDHPKTGKRFSNWILLDWPRVLLATAQQKLFWDMLPNTQDGARANFKFCKFNDIPEECVVARYTSNPDIIL